MKKFFQQLMNKLEKNTNCLVLVVIIIVMLVVLVQLGLNNYKENFVTSELDHNRITHSHEHTHTPVSVANPLGDSSKHSHSSTHSHSSKGICVGKPTEVTHTKTDSSCPKLTNKTNKSVSSSINKCKSKYDKDDNDKDSCCQCKELDEYDITKHPDIKSYILKSTMNPTPNCPKCPDLNNLAPKSMIKPDKDSDYILKSQIPKCEMPDMSQYVYKSSIPPAEKCEKFDKEQYILKSQIPTPPDMNNYMLKKDAIKMMNARVKEEQEHDKKHNKKIGDFDVRTHPDFYPILSEEVNKRKGEDLTLNDKIRKMLESNFDRLKKFFNNTHNQKIHKDHDVEMKHIRNLEKYLENIENEEAEDYHPHLRHSHHQVNTRVRALTQAQAQAQAQTQTQGQTQEEVMMESVQRNLEEQLEEETRNNNRQNCNVMKGVKRHPGKKPSFYTKF